MDLWKLIPKDLHENLQFREWIYAKARFDPKLQRALKAYCRKDILFWVNVFVWTYDPRPGAGNKKNPFITYAEFQDDAILQTQDAIRVGEPVVEPKSRDMGASWIFLFTFDHFSTFENDCTFFVMSYKAKVVDEKGNPNTLFWKIDFLHEHLPYWLRPRIEVANTKQRTSMRFRYLDTGSTIIGGTTTTSSGIGGRATAAGVDEISRYEPRIAEMVISGLKDVTDCVIYPFTRSPEMGKQHPSYALVKLAKAGNLRFLPMHWTQHPVKAKGLYRVDPKTRAIEIIDKTYDFSKYDFKKWKALDGRFEFHSPWFDKYRSKTTDKNVADNLEFDDDVSANSPFDVNMVNEHISLYSRPPDLEGDIEFDPVTGDPHGWIDMRGGPIKLWMPLDFNGKPPPVQYVAGEDTSLGVGKTPSCMSVANVIPGEKVLEMTEAFLKPDQFAVKCVAVCRWLNCPAYKTLLAWEKNGPGETFGQEVQKLNYYPIYWHVDRTKPGLNKPAPTPGVSPNIKGLMFDFYAASLRRAEFINRSEKALRQMHEWQNTPIGPKHNADKNRVNDPSGATKNHGDLTVSDAICDMMRREKGGGLIAKQKEPVQPGSLAYFMQEEERERDRNKALYPNWNKRRA